jgi:membrane fusion protein (multidrug efflux system)
MNQLKRHARSTVGVGSVFAFVLCGVWLLDATAQDQRKPIPDQPVAKTPTRGGQQITGTDFRVKLIRQVLLGFDRVGTISELDLQEGMRVKSGQVIAKLDDQVAIAALNSAEKKASNDVHKQYATASFAVSKNEHEQALLANKNAGMAVVPLIEIKRLFLAERRSQLQIQQADHDRAVAVLDRDLALAQLKTYRLRAPFDGIVTRRFKQKGEAIRQGDPVIELIDISTMKVEGRIPLARAIRLRPGQNVRVQLIDNNDRTGTLPAAFQEATFPGRLVYIDPGVSLVGERDVRVWAEVANKGGLLRHGLIAEITIDTASTR